MKKIFLNWIPEVYIGFITAVPKFTAVLITFYHYKKNKYRHLLFWGVGWLFIALGFLSITLSTLFLSKDFIIFGIFCFIPQAFCMAFLADSITRDSIDPIKTHAMTAAAVGIFIFSLDPNSIIEFTTPYGYKMLDIAGNLRYAFSILIGLAGITYIYYMAKIYWNAPKNFKFYASLNLLGAILAGMLAPGSYITGLIWIIPAVHFIFMALATLPATLTFVIRPKLAYILPLKKIHHIYFFTSDGGCIYDHSFKLEKGISPSLVAGGLTGVSALIQEVTQTETKIKIVKQEDMSIILEYGKYISAALISEANLSMLRKKMVNAVQVVEEYYQSEFEKYSGKISVFSKIGEFVQKIFEA